MVSLITGALGTWVVAASLCVLLTVEPSSATAIAVPEAEPEPCCGLVAGALGFAGGYLIGRHSHRHRGCGGCGCGGCGGGCGWCGGGYYGRRRRSLDEILEEDVLEDIYWQISNEDQDQCGLKLVCELAQKDPNDLSKEEFMILLPYRGRKEEVTTSYYGLYDQAAWHGQEGHKCHEAFPLCAFTSAQMMLGYKNDTRLTL
ncbi:uncharacterized protein LOC135223727 [Macrobrachium nipponense]|uniref:uncharacterized protein LOC135223727 n=1 Tax=Macrobrachium nipponense TaxID=159736 RepID=UPI0030C7F558